MHPLTPAHVEALAAEYAVEASLVRLADLRLRQVALTEAIRRLHQQPPTSDRTPVPDCLTKHPSLGGVHLSLLHIAKDVRERLQSVGGGQKDVETLDALREVCAEWFVEDVRETFLRSWDRAAR